MYAEVFPLVFNSLTLFPLLRLYEDMNLTIKNINDDKLKGAALSQQLHWKNQRRLPPLPSHPYVCV